jgi:cell division protein FtsQ
VDRFGVSIRDVAGRQAGLPLLSTSAAATALRGNQAVRAAAVVLAELPSRIAGKVRVVSAISSSDVSLTLTNGSVVVWGSTARAKEKAKELTVLMHRHARSYDVSGTGTAVTQG